MKPLIGVIIPFMTSKGPFRTNFWMIFTQVWALNLADVFGGVKGVKWMSIRKFLGRNLTIPEGGFVEKTLPEIDIFALENGWLEVGRLFFLGGGEGVFSAAKVGFREGRLPNFSPKDPNVGEQVQPAIFSKQCVDNNTYLIWLLLHIVLGAHW